MALLYLDTSALVKLYIEETGTERIAELVLSDSNCSLSTSAITQVEFHSAIDRRRRRRGGDVGEDAAERAVERFNRRFKSEFFRYPLDDQTLDLACVLVSRHALRAYDAVHLAACLFLLRLRSRDDLTFVSADRRLLTAARSEGLAVLNPEES